MVGNNVYWGSNWYAADNLELYRIELLQDWHEKLSKNINNSICTSNQGCVNLVS